MSNRAGRTALGSISHSEANSQLSRIGKASRDVTKGISHNGSNSLSINAWGGEPQRTKSTKQSPPSNITKSFESRFTSSRVNNDSPKDKNIVKVNGHYYEILNLLGEGGTSKVYVARNPEGQEVAIKVVDLTKVSDAVLNSLMNEVEILQQFKDSKEIIHMYEYDNTGSTMYIVQELGGYSMKEIIEEKFDNAPSKFDSNFIHKTWQEMLAAVRVCHERKILHADLKPANFLMVNKRLKLIDFGIATRVAIHDDTTSVTRDIKVGTLNYMSPEAVNIDDDSKIGRPADIWALGCILYRLVYRRLPFPQDQPIAKVTAICGNYEIKYGSLEYTEDPPELPFLIDIMKQCLQRDPKARPDIEALMNHPYLHSYDENIIQHFKGLILLLQELYDEKMPPNINTTEWKYKLLHRCDKYHVTEYARIFSLDQIQYFSELSRDVLETYYDDEFDSEVGNRVIRVLAEYFMNGNPISIGEALRIFSIESELV
ncbi:CAMK family protein kinase [Trichomonas vaginalis G3]|uniref:CAMK family protein kinase n=1 Tax=Trichomonas vaginalis (strain ATCC PRA-98 / G3) TaxID=412133 RepID=A2FC79_TRIV3|nr:PKc Mps1 domain-containing protein [Trichomonas vaginalis G3]EAX97492.1 CAMK family protein kinase [Trichomonas vaginalis G3]KAI5547062.1 PKc Mps1 domain-containing protein [Trichomonas vaginalis G3]|eukprot:XP_001310422.1 CAMK family protein kinase [Trichomonas vaginalis G3]